MDINIKYGLGYYEEGNYKNKETTYSSLKEVKDAIQELKDNKRITLSYIQSYLEIDYKTLIETDDYYDLDYIYEK